METNDYVFGGADNKVMFTEPGDYIFEVIGVETGISAGEKTRGSRIIKLKLNLEPSGVHGYETLILAKNTQWRVDTFVRCTGLECPIGQCPDGFKDGEEYKLIGLRGWATFNIEENKGKKYNRVVVWLTNKEKLQRKPWPNPADAKVEEEDVPF